MRILTRAVGAALLLAAPALLFADVDLGVRSGDTAKGTIDPAGENETFRFFVPAQAKVVVKAKGLSKFPVSLALLDENSMIAAPSVEKGTGSSVSTPVANSGEYRAVVTSRPGAATGDYAFSVKLTQGKTRSGTLAGVPSAEVREFRFPVLAGTQVTITAAAAPGSPALPNLRELDGPQGFLADLTDAASGKVDRAAKRTLPFDGEYALGVENTGPAGDIVITVKQKAPKYKPRAIDVTAKKLGAGGSFAVSRVIGAEGGAVTVPDLGGAGGPFDISGSAVDIPPGALPQGGTIFVGTSPELDPSGEDAPLGATVSFGPDGTKFASNVTLKIPVDLAAVGGVESEVKIYARDAKGKVTLVPGPYDFLTNPGFVSFPSAHFSSYVAAGIASTVGGQGFGTVFIGVSLGRDLALATGFGNFSRQYFLADGTFTAKEVVDIGGGSVSVDVFAGGGTDIVYPTDRLMADLQGPPTAILEHNGLVFIATAHRVFVVDLSTDVLDVFAGDGQDTTGGDGGPATAASFQTCLDVFVDSATGLYLVDTAAGRVRLVDVAGNISTFAGGAIGMPPGFDNVDANAAILVGPTGFTQDAFGNGYVSEAVRVRRIDATNHFITTLCGSTANTSGCTTSSASGTAARFTQLSSIAYDGDQTSALYITDESCHAIYSVDPLNGATTTVLGTPGASGFSPDGATNGPIATPRGVVPLGPLGFLFLDVNNGRIRLFQF